MLKAERGMNALPYISLAEAEHLKAQICRCFRANEAGPQHSSEFTMIEWYRSWDTLETIAHDTETLVHDLAVAHRGTPTVLVERSESSRSSRWRS